MKKVLPIVLVAVIVILGFVFVPKLTHTCSDCGEFFVGTGYEPNALEDMMSDEELIVKLEELKKELFNLRLNHATGQLNNPLALNACKKDIARVMTVMRERQLAKKA